MAQSRVSHPLVDLGFVVRRPFAEANTCVFAIGCTFSTAVLAVPQIAALPPVTG